MQRGYIDLSDLKLIDASEDEIQELNLQIGDVLFTEGGDADKVGRGWIWEGQLDECIHQNHVFRLRVRVPHVDPRFVSHQANSIGQAWFQSYAKQTTNLASISLTALRSYPVALPSVEEQIEILSQIASGLEKLGGQKAAIEKGIEAASDHRRALLAAAMGGRLTELNRPDEPAMSLGGPNKQQGVPANMKKTIASRRQTAKANAPSVVLGALGDAPGSIMTFEELRARTSLPYEELRDALFDLLGGSSPSVKQAFNREQKIVCFERVWNEAP